MSRYIPHVCFASQDRLLQALEVRRGLQAEFPDERAAKPVEHLQGLCTPATEVKRDHVLPVQALVQWVLHGEARQLRHHLAVHAELEFRLDQALERYEPPLLLSQGKPAQRGPLLHDEDYTVVAKYGSEYRGFVQYYLLAQDVFRLEKLRWVMETSMLKTLAGKHKSTVAKMARKYKASIDTPGGPRTCFQVTVHREQGKKPLAARFGGIPLTRQRTAIMTDLKPIMATTKRNELIHRLLAGRCELCEEKEGLQVHHIRKLADLNKPGRPERPSWMRLMAMRKRKTLAVCEQCHQNIHAGRATTTRK